MVIETFSASILPVEGEVLLQEEENGHSVVVDDVVAPRPVKMINDDNSVNTLANSNPRVAIDSADDIDAAAVVCVVVGGKERDETGTNS